MIVFESKSTSKEFGKLPEKDAEELIKTKYPSIFKHLMPFKAVAKKRADKGEYWWELRNCAYYSLCSKEKIIFPNLQNSNKFSWDDSGTYINAPAVFLPTSDKSLLAILNSKAIWYFLKSICVIRSGGFIEVKPQYFEQIPIPEITENEKKPFVKLVDEILKAKRKNKDADRLTLENEIDKLVYQLYGLSEEEIKIVEGK